MTTIGKTRRPNSSGVLGTTEAPAARGVLHAPAAGEFAHRRQAPPPALADWVEHFWRVRWNLDGLPPKTVETLPHPNVHIVIEPCSAQVFGVHTGRWTRVLEGRSSAFGIKFRPGAFRPFLRRPVSSLRDTSMPVAALFGPHARELEAIADCTNDAGGDDHAVELASQFLLARLPAADPAALLASHMVDSAAHRPELHSASALAQQYSMSLRATQRLFNDYVGIGPKWVINRYRMHEAIARAQAGMAVSWASLAQELGYFDQAHFITDFRKLVGTTPAGYVNGWSARQ